MFCLFILLVNFAACVGQGEYARVLPDSTSAVHASPRFKMKLAFHAGLSVDLVSTYQELVTALLSRIPSSVYRVLSALRAKWLQPHVEAERDMMK